MRVAVRRLRSVLRAFRPAVGPAPAVREFDAGLKRLAARLGAARDLDVFLGGLGAEVAAAVPGEARIAALLRAVEDRRRAAYAALREAELDAPGFRLLVLDGMALVAGRPWRDLDGGEAAGLEEPLEAFAARLLDKRWRRLRAEGEEIRAMDEAALHALRLTGKRLRYAAELFAPLWPGKAARRLLKRLSALQEALGVANDTAVARALVAGLGPRVPAWAVGAVEGYAAARNPGARAEALERWDGLMDAKPFWSGG
jgi:CHAD domain-containing protein